MGGSQSASIYKRRVVKQNTYLSDVALHLFLQSDFQVKEIERHLNGTDSGGEIVEALESPGRGCKNLGLCRSMTNIQEIPSEKEANNEHDSGYCYSTTSSVNDLLYTSVGKTFTRDESRYYLSLPADLDKVTKAIEKIDRAIDECGRNKRNLLQSVTSDSGHPVSSSSQSSEHDYTESLSDDDFIVSDNYDADDEYDWCGDWYGEYQNYAPTYNTVNNNIDDITELPFNKSFFERGTECFSQIEKNIELLKSRPRVSERALYMDDSDDCIHESEYDVIDSGDNLEDICEIPESGQCNSLNENKPKRKTSRSSSQNDSCGKPRKKRGKVRSLPNIPAGVKKKLCRSQTFNGTDRPRSTQQLEHTRLRRATTVSLQEMMVQASLCKVGKSGEESTFPPTSDPDSHRRQILEVFDSNLDTTAESNTEPRRSYRLKSRTYSTESEFSIPLRRQRKQKLVRGRFEVTLVGEDSFKEEEQTGDNVSLREAFKQWGIPSKRLTECTLRPSLEHDNNSTLSPLNVNRTFEDHLDRTPTNQRPNDLCFVPSDVIEVMASLLDHVETNLETVSEKPDVDQPLANELIPISVTDLSTLDNSGNTTPGTTSGKWSAESRSPDLSSRSLLLSKCTNFDGSNMVCCRTQSPVNPVLLNTYDVISDVPVACNLDEYCIVDERRTPTQHL